jgi:nucleoside-diphosphate-sugar epimerase
MKIVVTGAAGYIGSSICDYFSSMGHQVVGFDNLWYDQGTLVSKVFTKRDCTLYLEDVTFWSNNLIEHIKTADVIIPLAAFVGAPLCDKHPKFTKTLNHDWFANLIPHLDNQLVIYPNTNSGYGSTGDQICTEETPSNPLSLYAQTKQAAEDLLINNYHNAVCFRLATVFGWSYRPRTDLLVNNLVKVSQRDGHITVFDPQFRRNYIHVKDIVNGFNFAIKEARHMKGQVYNLGNDYLNTTKLDLVKLVCKELGTTFSINTEQTDPDKRDYNVSSAKLYDLGYKPRYKLEYGIAEMSKFYKFMSENDEERCRNY